MTMTRHQIEDVFTTSRLPPHTYIKPANYRDVRADILQPGKHLLLEGPSGVGKTCVIYKVFEELGWAFGTQYTVINGRQFDAATQIDTFLNESLKRTVSFPQVLLIDDFHFLSAPKRSEIGTTLKQ